MRTFLLGVCLLLISTGFPVLPFWLLFISFLADWRLIIYTFILLFTSGCVTYFLSRSRGTLCLHGGVWVAVRCRGRSDV